jgi:hypothetical protein
MVGQSVGRHQQLAGVTAMANRFDAREQPDRMARAERGRPQRHTAPSGRGWPELRAIDGFPRRRVIPRTLKRM